MCGLSAQPIPRARPAALPLLLALAAWGCAPSRGGDGEPGGPGPGPTMKMTDPDVVDAGAPGDADKQFGGPATGAAPSLVYPLDGAMLARNISQMELFWRAGAGQTVFRLVVDGATYKRTFYLGTDGCTGDRCRYPVAEEDWQALARAAAGQTLTLTLSGTAGAGQPVGTAKALTLRFSPEDVKGGLYYFAASARGLYRLPFGGKKAVPFLGSAATQCVGCHAVTPDGKKVAATFQGGDGYGGMVDGADATKVIVQPNRERWNFATFNPDGTRLLTVWAGVMSLRDGQTGAVIKTVSQAMLGGPATMPEWSPDGNSIVFVRVAAPEGRMGKDISDGGFAAGDWILGDAGEIALLPYNGGSFGQAVTLVPRTQGVEYHTYPSFSPDSQWIVFNSARKRDCASPTAANNGVNVSGLCMSYDQKAARLRLVRAQEGATPIELEIATHGSGMTTSWPKFAPFQQAGGKLVFFTFSAKFDYGWEVDQAKIFSTTKLDRPQIWMSAIDLSKAGAGGDGSYAPFWLPFQSSKTNNHEVIWTRDIACVKPTDCGNEFDCLAGVCVPKLG